MNSIFYTLIFAATFLFACALRAESKFIRHMLFILSLMSYTLCIIVNLEKIGIHDEKMRFTISWVTGAVFIVVFLIFSACSLTRYFKKKGNI